MDQIGQRSTDLVKRGVRPWFIGSSQDPMIRRRGMGNDLDIAFRHMAVDAIVRGLLMKPGCERNLATLVCVTGKASARVVCGRFGYRGLNVRIMAAETTHSSRTRPVTLTQRHRIVMLDMVRIGR